MDWLAAVSLSVGVFCLCCLVARISFQKGYQAGCRDSYEHEDEAPTVCIAWLPPPPVRETRRDA